MTHDLPPIVAGERHAPVPIGPLTGRRRALRRLFAYGTAILNRGLDLLPVGRWLHRRIQRELEFTRLEVPLRAGCDSLAGLRIAFLSDLHLGSFLDARDFAQLCARVAASEPHAVLFGGDLINTRDRELLLMSEGLRLLRPPLGVFAVPGNHDLFWGREIGLWTAFLHEHGVQVLVNKGVRLEFGGGSLWLCGVDDLTEGRPDLRAALAGRGAGEPTVLLSHHPDFFFEAAAADVDLTLAGHTHGGQIRLFGRAPVHHSRFGYEQGWFCEGDARLYVGRGVGVTVLPLRIGAPPEVPILTFAAVTQRPGCAEPANDRCPCGATGGPARE